MGGAVSGVAGPNWALVGDAAGCVNPLNGEGIDYGLETGRLLAEQLSTDPDGELTAAWPALLRAHYGEAFSIARRLAGLFTVPGLRTAAGPVGMRSRALMTLALRVMGNLVTAEDTDALARVWRAAGRLSVRLDHRPPPRTTARPPPAAPLPARRAPSPDARGASGQLSESRSASSSAGSGAAFP